MNDLSQLVEECQRLNAEGKSHDDLVAVLRDRGCSKVESMTVVARGLGMGLSEAKAIVHNSKVWSDFRERHDRFHQSIEDGLAEGR